MLLSLPAGTKMFQFPAFASASRMPESLPAGCPIRTSAGLSVFAARRSFSQLVTSFFASESLGIPHAPFVIPLFLNFRLCVRHVLSPMVCSCETLLCFYSCLLASDQYRCTGLALPALSLFSESRIRGSQDPPYPVFFPQVRAAGSGLQKGGVPAAPSGTATLLRLSPSHRFRSRARLAATHFKRPRLPWLDGRCVQGPGTYSPRHG